MNKLHTIIKEEVSKLLNEDGITKEVWNQDNISELLDAIGQENYRFMHSSCNGASFGDYGKVKFTCDANFQKLYLKFESPEEATMAQNGMEAQLTNPYQFEMNMQYPDTVEVTFY